MNLQSKPPSSKWRPMKLCCTTYTVPWKWRRWERWGGKSNKNTQIINEVESSLSWCIEEFQRAWGTASVIHSPWICLHNCSSTGEKRGVMRTTFRCWKMCWLEFPKTNTICIQKSGIQWKQQENVQLMKDDVHGTSPYVVSFLLYIWKMLYIWGWRHNQIMYIYGNCYGGKHNIATITCDRS